MTMPDLGSERPGEATETRQWADRSRTESGANVSDRKFLIALAVIVVVIAIFALALYY